MERKDDEKSWRMSPVVLLAVDNVAKSNLTKREKHWHKTFADFRVKEKGIGTEIFEAQPIIDFLREAEWLGNAGNLSQISQYIDAAGLASSQGDLHAYRKCNSQTKSEKCSHKAVKRQGYLGSNQAAPAVTQMSFNY